MVAFEHSISFHRSGFRLLLVHFEKGRLRAPTTTPGLPSLRRLIPSGLHSLQGNRRGKVPKKIRIFGPENPKSETNSKGQNWKMENQNRAKAGLVFPIAPFPRSSLV